MNYRLLSVNDLLEERKTSIKRLDNYLDVVKKEDRKLTKDEENDFNTIKKNIVEIDNAFLELRDSKKLDNNIFTNGLNKKNNNYKMENRNLNLIENINKFINSNSLSDEMSELVDETRAQNRSVGITQRRGQIAIPLEIRADIMAGTATQGSEAIATDTKGLLLDFRNNSFLGKVGATFINGQQSNLSYPKYSGSNMSWKAETDSADDGAGVFSEVELKAKRLTGYIDVSKTFLTQTDQATESILMKDIEMAIIEKLEETILSDFEGSVIIPAGIFSGVSYAETGATTWEKVVSLETSLNNNSALNGNLSYVVHPNVNKSLKTTIKAGSNEFIKVGNTLNEYNCIVSSHTPKVGDEYGVVFGNFQDLVITQFGNLDITIDPYSLSKYNKVRLVCNAYFNFAKLRDDSFSFATLS